MESKNKNSFKIFENININSLADYIFYIENLDSKQLINNIYEIEKIIKNFHIKVKNDSNLEDLRLLLISSKIMIELLDSLNEFEKSLINWKDVLKNLIFEKISINSVLKNTIREIKRKNSFEIQKTIKILLNKTKSFKDFRFTQKKISEFF